MILKVKNLDEVMKEATLGMATDEAMEIGRMEEVETWELIRAHRHDHLP